MNEERAPEYGGFGSEPSTPLEYLERIIASLPPGDPTRSELIDLRSNFAEQEEMISEARHTIEKLDEGHQESHVPGESNRDLSRQSEQGDCPDCRGRF